MKRNVSPMPTRFNLRRNVVVEEAICCPVRYYSPRPSNSTSANSRVTKSCTKLVRSDSGDGRPGASCVFSDDKVRNPLRQAGNGTRWVDSDSLRNDRAIGHVQTRISKDCAGVVDNTVAGFGAHIASAERMGSDEPLQVGPGGRNPLFAAGNFGKHGVHGDDGVSRLGIFRPVKLQMLAPRPPPFVSQIEPSIRFVHAVGKPGHDVTKRIFVAQVACDGIQDDLQIRLLDSVFRLAELFFQIVAQEWREPAIFNHEPLVLERLIEEIDVARYRRPPRGSDGARVRIPAQ